MDSSRKFAMCLCIVPVCVDVCTRVSTSKIDYWCGDLESTNNFLTGTTILDDETYDESEPDFEAKVFLSAIWGGNSVLKQGNYGMMHHQ